MVSYLSCGGYMSRTGNSGISPCCSPGSCTTNPPSGLAGSPGHGRLVPRVNHSALHMLVTKSKAFVPAASPGSPTACGSGVGTGVTVAVGTGVLVGESVGVIVEGAGVSEPKPEPRLPPPRPPPPNRRPNPNPQPASSRLPRSTISNVLRISHRMN